MLRNLWSIHADNGISAVIRSKVQKINPEWPGDQPQWQADEIHRRLCHEGRENPGNRAPGVDRPADRFGEGNYTGQFYVMPWYYRHQVQILNLVGDFLENDYGPGGL